MKTTSDANTSRQNTNQPSDSKRRVMAFLQSALKQETEKRQQAEYNLLEYRQRSLKIENEFSRLIQKYDNHVAIVNGRLSYSQQIWNKLINQIENFNQNSEMLLEKRCGEITAMMSRRIGEILERTEYQIQKNKKLSEQEFKTIREQIKEVLILARQIDTENQEVRKINQQLNFKVTMLREEKSLLVEELAQKKMLLKKLAQLTPDSAITTIQSPRRGRSKLTSRRQTISIPKFMCEPSIRNFTSIIDNPQKTMSRHLSSSKDKRQLKQIKQPPNTLTENHLKVVIQRQQRKNKELKSIVARLQTKCNETNLYVQKALQELKDQDKDGSFGRILRNMKMKMVGGEIFKKNSMMSFQQLEELIVT